MHSIEQHWLTDARRCDSPNFDERGDHVIDTIVIHNISLPPGEFGGRHIDELFCNALNPDEHSYFAEICALKVSAHLMINRQGVVTQYVAFDKRAWHAGESAYKGRQRFNDFSIGVELEGTDTQAYDSRQYAALAEIVLRLQQEYPCITRENIVGHSTIAPDRKTDPGQAFDWARLHGLLSATNL